MDEDTDSPIFVGLHFNFTTTEPNYFTYIKVMTEAEVRKDAHRHPDTIYFFVDQLNDLQEE